MYAGRVISILNSDPKYNEMKDKLQNAESKVSSYKTRSFNHNQADGKCLDENSMAREVRLAPVHSDKRLIKKCAVLLPCHNLFHVVIGTFSNL